MRVSNLRAKFLLKDPLAACNPAARSLAARCLDAAVEIHRHASKNSKLASFIIILTPHVFYSIKQTVLLVFLSREVRQLVNSSQEQLHQWYSCTALLPY